jgi:hypothetical protein
MRHLILICGLWMMTSGAWAAKDPVPVPTAPKKDSSQTAHNFEDLLVQGKYHFSDESVMTVEEDKVLDSLIGVRSDFKDRLKKSVSQQ